MLHVIEVTIAYVFSISPCCMAVEQECFNTHRVLHAIAVTPCICALPSLLPVFARLLEAPSMHIADYLQQIDVSEPNFPGDPSRVVPGCHVDEPMWSPYLHCIIVHDSI
jgi:hypothetical protein